MFQLFDLIMTSPVGVFIVAKAQDVVYAAFVVSDCDDCGFNDLGKLLFGGVALAIVLGIGISIVFRKIKAREGSETGFVSIHGTAKSKDAG